MDPQEGQEKLSPGLGQIHCGGHLWECCTKDLESLNWKQVGKNLDTVDKLLKLMKMLVVKKWNVLLTKVAS